MAVKIDGTLFSTNESKDESHCPKCGSVLVIKHGKHGPFSACSAYPECNFILSLHKNDLHVVKELGVPCPKCDGLLVLRQGRFGMFIGCSSYPACQHIEKREPLVEKLGFECPECKSGQLQEKKSRFGNVFYACDFYPRCTFSVNLKPIEGQCSSCGFSLLLEKKERSGGGRLCANKACQHVQSESDSASLIT